MSEYELTAKVLQVGWTEPFDESADPFYEKRLARGIAKNAEELLRAMAGDGILERVPMNGIGRIFYAIPEKHQHNWSIDSVDDLTTNYLCACGAQARSILEILEEP